MKLLRRRLALFTVVLLGTIRLLLTSVTPGGLSEVTRHSSSRRVAPYALPANFFEPPHPQHALWDRFTSWLQDHLRRQDSAIRGAAAPDLRTGIH
jgi:hypothetical protein